MARMSAEVVSNHNRGAIISSPSKRPLVIERHQDYLSHAPLVSPIADEKLVAENDALRSKLHAENKINGERRQELPRGR